MSEMKENTAPHHAQADAPRRVTVLRIYRDFAEADGTEFRMDEVDRVVALASALARVRPA